MCFPGSSMSNREVKLYLTDIDDAIVTIQSYAQNITYEDLVKDREDPGSDHS